MTTRDWLFVFEAGAANCLVAGAFLLLLLRVWPRVFLRRFPEEVRAVVPPLTPRERRLGSLAALPLFAMLLGFPTWAAWRIHIQHDAASGFVSVFLGAYVVWMIFNLFDWLVLDELVIGRLRPTWLTLPGAEHVPLRFDHAEHARAFLRGSFGGLAVAAVIAASVRWLG